MTMTRTKLTLLLFSLVIAMSACSIYHVRSEDITTDYHPSKSSIKDVSLLENVTQPHEVIGYITVNAERSQNMNEIIERIKYEAAVLGADAVTNIKSDASGTWKKLPVQKFIGNGYVRANFSATAIVLK